MNKFMSLFFIIALIGFTVTVAQSIEITLYEGIFDGVTDFNNSRSGIMSYITIYFRILFFDMQSIPFWFTMFIFYPLNFVLLYYVADIAKDLIPLT